MDRFANLMLHASQAFGAPAYLARAIGCPPLEIYRWIAGVDRPEPAQRQRLESLLRGALAQRAPEPLDRRRWGDR